MATEDNIKVDNEHLVSDIKNLKVEDHDRPFGELEFQVSQVIERLEAGASLSQEGNNNKEERKISTSILEPESSSLESILEYIEELIYKNDPNNDNCWPLPSLNDVVKSAVLAHSVAAYTSCLERTHLQKVNAIINSETTRWLTHIFRFFDYNAYYHYDHLEGLVKVTRMMLHYKYPRYLEDGCLALTSQLPTIYSSVASPLGVVQYLCRQLGLPLACIRPVPVNSVFGSNQTMDTMALQRMLAEDAASEGRAPLLVLGEAGTACAGHSDAAPRLAQLCAAHGAWLHVRGNCLAALALVPAPGFVDEAPRIADSVTLPLGTWLGIPGLPVVTLYRLPEPQVPADPLRPINAVNATREGTLPLLAGLAGADHAVRRLPALPLWVALKYAGKQAVVKRIRSAFEACHLVWDIVAKLPSIRILSKRPGGEGGAISVEDLTTKPMNTTLLLDVAVPCVVFQFMPTVPDGSTLGRVPSYYDKLNSWLGQILQRDCQQITIDLCESETYGIVLRYCPLESAPDSWLEEGPPTPEHLASLIACLDVQLEILLATVAHKQTFMKLVEESPVLKLVEMPGWAGLGGVRYVPMGWEALLTDQAKEELNHLNTALVDTLRATDSAFSLGEGVDGLVCVRFGMVTADTEVEELLGLVISIGREVEEQSKVLDTMTEIVKRGIEAATLDLQRESSEKLWQEGLLRRVPVVGGLVNWLSPAQPAAVRGRCLHLSQGTVESTENIYKYHMQIPAGTVPHGVSKAPPPAEVQTAVGEPVKLPSSASHSRTSSQSSAQTKAAATNTAVPPAVVEMNDT